MKQSLFESRHQPQWQAFAEQLKQLEQGKTRARDVADFPHHYRRVCQHLALAQERGYSSYLIDPLQQLALRGTNNCIATAATWGRTHWASSWLTSLVWCVNSGASC